MNLTRPHYGVMAGLLSVPLCLAAACGGAGPPESGGAMPVGGGGSDPRAVAEQRLETVVLPDLSEVSDSVREQVLARWGPVDRLQAGEADSGPDAAGHYGALGMVLMAAEFAVAAVPAFRNARALAPDDVRWPYYLAHLQRDAGALDGAAARFEEARRLDPDAMAILVWLGDVRLAQGDAEAAEPLFARALELYPDSVSARFGLARAALMHEEFEAAARGLEEILELEPSATAAHYPLGQAYLRLGEPDRAEVHLRQREAADIRPADPLMDALNALLESAQAYETRGIQALNREDWDGAVAAFRRGLELESEDAELRHRLATALYLRGDTDVARIEFERAATEGTNLAQADYSLGVLLQDEGRHAEAVGRFAAALEQRPTYAEARLRLAWNLRRAGDPEAALAHYEQVSRANPDLVEAAFGHAMALVVLRRWEDARTSLEQALDAHPDDAGLAHARARLLAAAPDAQVRDGEQALAIADRLAAQARTLDLGETMAMALAEVGAFDRAAALQRDLITGARRAGLTDVIRRLEENLRRYERGEASRTPWPEGEVP
ncbi:MAG: tetratricopeptide repeat protein [Acidobacteria bacterium]|nr:tetratricopeptide repeat protein [Acidobacteriota bacterium]